MTKRQLCKVPVWQTSAGSVHNAGLRACRVFPSKLFFTLPDVDNSVSLFVCEDHLRGKFGVINIDRCSELNAFPFRAFADN